MQKRSPLGGSDGSLSCLWGFRALRRCAEVFQFWVERAVGLTAGQAGNAECMLRSVGGAAQISLSSTEMRLVQLLDQSETYRSPQDIIELSIECLALAQLGSHGIDLQTALAYSALARAYQQAGSTGAAGRHAAQAQAALARIAPTLWKGVGWQRSSLPKSAEAMLTCGRQMVECAPLPTRDYARAEESLWLATGAFHGDHGLRDPRFCPIFCSFARMVMQLSGDFAMAEALLVRERELLLLLGVDGFRGFAAMLGGGVLSNLRFGVLGYPTTHDRLVQLDRERALLMLRHGKLLDTRADQLRLAWDEEAAHGTHSAAQETSACNQITPKKAYRWAVAPSSGGCTSRGGAAALTVRSTDRAQSSLVQQSGSLTSSIASFPVRSRAESYMPYPKTAEFQLRRTESLQLRREESYEQQRRCFAAVGAGLLASFMQDSSPATATAVVAAARQHNSCPAELTALATRKRLIADDILEASSHGGGGGDKGSQCTESATDAAQLASVYQHNGQWKRAEAACLHAISNLETLHGASNPQALRLWGNVSESRMSRGAYGLAVRDLAHIVAMTGLQYGPESLELIAPLQNLCKAFVLARRWQQAIAALSRAQAISVKRNGAEHCDTERLEKVFQSLHRQATGSAVRSSDPERL